MSDDEFQSNVIGYNFEPEHEDTNSDISSNTSSDESDKDNEDNRKNNTNWCSCGNCKRDLLVNEKEYKCCRENKKLSKQNGEFLYYQRS